MRSTEKWLHDHNYIINAILFIIAFLLPIIIDKLPESFGIPPIVVGVILVSILEIIVTYEGYSEKKKEEKKREVYRQNERAKTILSQLNLLYEDKTESLRENTYCHQNNIKAGMLFYNVHQYMHQICINLRSTVAKLIEEDSEYVDVSLIYKYSNEEEWKWIAGKSGISGAQNLNDFVESDGTLFNYLINNTNESPIFYNRKEELIDENHYKDGRRDRLFKCKGSVMAMVLTYFNNERELIDAVLVISTYGVRFVDVEENSGEEINAFKKILIYEVLPYYVSLLQSEMGAMYLRHIYLEDE